MKNETFFKDSLITRSITQVGPKKWGMKLGDHLDQVGEFFCGYPGYYNDKLLILLEFCCF